MPDRKSSPATLKTLHFIRESPVLPHGGSQRAWQPASSNSGFKNSRMFAQSSATRIVGMARPIAKAIL